MFRLGQNNAHASLSPTADVRVLVEAPLAEDAAPIAGATDGMHLPLTDGEKRLIAFLVEMAVKSWKPAP